MRRQADDQEPPVQVVTTARESLEHEQVARIRRYLFTMGIRTAAFVLAVVTHGPIRWVFVVLAVVLPYVAVVAVNAVRPRAVGEMRRNPQNLDQRRQLPK